MKALILAAGRGTRMPEFTGRMSKVLVPVAGTPILERMLDALLAIDVQDIVITTGHFAEQIEAFVASQEKYRGMQIEYAFDPRFAETNYIHGMWLAREKLFDTDLLLFHGDMVFDRHVLEGIAATKTSSVCVREGGELPEKDFKSRVREGRVTEIGVKVFGPDARACMPIYKWLQADFMLWMEEIGRFVEAGKVTCYAEDAFNAVSDRIHLAAFRYTTQDLCMEIDTAADLQEAERLLSQASGG